jgi:hypothetical protein
MLPLCPYALRDFLLASYVYQNMLLNYGSSLQVVLHYMRPNHLQSIRKHVLETKNLFLRKKNVCVTCYQPYFKVSPVLSNSDTSVNIVTAIPQLI